ncbi:hypothetical protein, partial [Bordetella pertussis]|uniref:hypothetical protein n=3 Tax=Bordetella pertussis TaxID=520 RepID=UPI001C9E47ED
RGLHKAPRRAARARHACAAILHYGQSRAAPRRAWAVGRFESFQTVRGFFRPAARGAKSAQEL